MSSDAKNYSLLLIESIIDNKKSENIATEKPVENKKEVKKKNVKIAKK